MIHVHYLVAAFTGYCLVLAALQWLGNFKTKGENLCVSIGAAITLTGAMAAVVFLWIKGIGAL